MQKNYLLVCIIIICLFLCVGCKQKLTLIYLEKQADISIEPSEKDFMYSKGQSIKLKASPKDKYIFEKWVVDGKEMLNDTIEVKMDNDKKIVAHFSNIENIPISSKEWKYNFAEKCMVYTKGTSIYKVPISSISMNEIIKKYNTKLTDMQMKEYIENAIGKFVIFEGEIDSVSESGEVVVDYTSYKPFYFLNCSNSFSFNASIKDAKDLRIGSRISVIGKISEIIGKGDINTACGGRQFVTVTLTNIRIK